MLAIVLGNWLEICFLSLVSSIQVAHLAWVPIGSLAKLSSSFCNRSVLAPCRWLMLSLARWSHKWLLFGFKSLLQYLTLSWFSTKNEVMLQITILVVLNHIRFRIESLLTESVILNHVRFWIEPFAIRVLPYSTTSGPEQSLLLLE